MIVENKGLPRGAVRGVTLVEMLIVVAIIGLLAAIAYPTYSQHVQKTRRGDLKTELYAVAQQLERCFSQFGAYNAAGCSRLNNSGRVNFTSEDGNYKITSPRMNASEYRLRAIAKNAQLKDESCRKLFLDSTGRTWSKDKDNSDSTAECWS